MNRRTPLSRKLAAVKHHGRATSKFHFVCTDVRIDSAALPQLGVRGSATGLLVQMARGPKICSTEEADVSRGALSEVEAGHVAWRRQLGFVATLCASKTGKSHSDKSYRVSLISVQPAAFGTTKRKRVELAFASVNIADYSSALTPIDVSLELEPPRASRAASATVSLSMKVGAKQLGPTDDDDASISSNLTNLTGGSRHLDERNLDGFAELLAADRTEQDLDGFGLESGSLPVRTPNFGAKKVRGAWAEDADEGGEAEAEAGAEAEAEAGGGADGGDSVDDSEEAADAGLGMGACGATAADEAAAADASASAESSVESGLESRLEEVRVQLRAELKEKSRLRGLLREANAALGEAQEARADAEAAAARAEAARAGARAAEAEAAEGEARGERKRWRRRRRGWRRQGRGWGRR